MVGSSKVKFSVHKEMLCGVSSFFRSAFTGSFREGRQQVMELPEDDPNIFELLVQWLYTDKYDLQQSDGPGDSFNYSEGIQLYCLAEKYDLSALKHKIYRAFYRETNETKMPPACSDTSYLYENTSAGSPLRQLYAEWWMSHVNLESFEKADIQKWLSGQPDLTHDLFLRLCAVAKRYVPKITR